MVKKFLYARFAIDNRMRMVYINIDSKNACR